MPDTWFLKGTGPVYAHTMRDENDPVFYTREGRPYILTPGPPRSKEEQKMERLRREAEKKCTV